MDLDLFVVKSESQKQRLANSTGHMVKSWCQTLCLKVCYGCVFVICLSFVCLLVFFERLTLHFHVEHEFSSAWILLC